MCSFFYIPFSDMSDNKSTIKRVRSKLSNPYGTSKSFAEAKTMGLKMKHARKHFGLTDINKPVKAPTEETINEMSEIMRKRFDEAHKFSNGFVAKLDNWSMSSDEASKKWRDAVFGTKNEEVLTAYGMNQTQLAERKELWQQGHRESGMRGYFSPFVVQGGVLRGGYTGHAKSVNVDGRQCAAIPVEVTGRKLINMRALYKNPMLFPETRRIKFTYGTWGSKQSAVHEQI